MTVVTTDGHLEQAGEGNCLHWPVFIAENSVAILQHSETVVRVVAGRSSNAPITEPTTMPNSQRMSGILQMLTIDDVARKLGVPVTDVRVLIDTNQLSHYRLGQHGELVRVIRRDLIAFKAAAHPPHSHGIEPVPTA